MGNLCFLYARSKYKSKYEFIIRREVNIWIHIYEHKIIFPYLVSIILTIHYNGINTYYFLNSTWSDTSETFVTTDSNWSTSIHKQMDRPMSGWPGQLLVTRAAWQRDDHQTLSGQFLYATNIHSYMGSCWLLHHIKVAIFFIWIERSWSSKGRRI